MINLTNKKSKIDFKKYLPYPSICCISVFLYAKMCDYVHQHSR